MRRPVALVLIALMVMGGSACGNAATPATQLAATPTVAPSATAMSTTVAATVTGTGAATATATSQAELTATTTQQPSAVLSLYALKYLLIDRFGPVGQSPGIFYCDPDVYPVARADETSQAARWMAAVDKTGEEYRAILKRLKLAATATLTGDQVMQVYQEHKHLNAIALSASAGGGYAFSLRAATTAGKGRSGQSIEGTISATGDIAVLKQQPAVLTCPICLAWGTRIDTPAGPLAVQDIRAGMTVWTQNAAGVRVAAEVLETSHTPVAADYRVVHARLADGRELYASPGHPTADGRAIGTLLPGDLLDGARVVSVNRERYFAAETYDLLPAGGTGFYWANGMLVGSTLAH